MPFMFKCESACGENQLIGFIQCLLGHRDCGSVAVWVAVPGEKYLLMRCVRPCPARWKTIVTGPHKDSLSLSTWMVCVWRAIACTELVEVKCTEQHVQCVGVLILSGDGSGCSQDRSQLENLSATSSTDLSRASPKASMCIFIADGVFALQEGTMSNPAYLYETPLETRVHTVKDVKADAFIALYANHLKKRGRFQLPKWIDYVKTAHAKELAPYDPDWLYIRAAAILRHLYIRPDCGVGGFRKVFSCRQRRGVRPNHTSKASGKIIRYILQQFEEMGLVESDPEKPGRRLTKNGQRELDVIARQCAKPAVASD
ncbi:ribosomal protein RPS19 [Toxoplasma gondii GT1]|uniref:Ribosomal protein RPS19 n=9 Tax=Toxoplasma gondii TaxID=5811 RepID=A0A125YMR9_TOXGV|nr:ribosomal protein RPS19 [Toxoplasma gondii GT1]ESS32294.1 ribosomal protein RPS19 [Toxoplasma gondii VEG]KFG31211.1 ribosomal protein RPS19 [Toxoplasma gondii p89]KFG33491.1 ribosomal protein RPS19 [Toxoplasma gondii FOU]KFH01861.1 ribosomal protein RPS19 [Toxoplasma gondii MAS]KFH13692.1 ribosomal protein RPS19 [Toxoplasma gondii VAND]PUA83627.1 ribosomal protein RPS19 [Toxoplasma gondii TgCATBr9]RQX68341.1 ribosomal protein RPS19 [Toxoplasma gondii CAST]